MTILRYSAFTTPAGGGNPAGVALNASAMDHVAMLGTAAQLGYSESAFLTPRKPREYEIRYFSPEREVDFCGHATVATAVALAEQRYGPGELVFRSNIGKIQVHVAETERGFTATLTTVIPATAELQAKDELLAALRWSESDLHPALPVGAAYAGLWHPVLWASSRERLAVLDYDFEALKTLMLREGWGTVSLLFRETPELIHSRNAFPVGGVIEDSATGAAAGALGGFLREYRLLPESGRFTVLQGEDMGQPCLLEVDAGREAGVLVSGTAQQILI